MLAYSQRPREGSLSTKQYYNPEYYPFLVPTLDDNGKQIGDLVQPEGRHTYHRDQEEMIYRRGPATKVGPRIF